MPQPRGNARLPGVPGVLAGLALGLVLGVVLGLVLGVSVRLDLGRSGAPGGSAAGTPAPQAHASATVPPTDPGRPVPPSGTPDSAGPRWLSPDGRDGATGSADDPLRDPQAALDGGATTIHLGRGTYAGFEVTRSNIEILGPDGGGARIEGKVRIRDVANVHVRDVELTGVVEPYTAALLVERGDDVSFEQVTATGNMFGIQLRDVSRVTITASTFTHNGSGIEIHGQARDVRIWGNRFEDNDRAVDDSRGANGINLYRADGPVVIADNVFRSNYNPDPTPDTDGGGGAIELYASSDVTITGNEIFDSSVMETGTEDDIECRRITFTRNVAYRGPHAAIQDGLVLRCASDSLIAHNTFDGFDNFALDLIHEAGAFGGSIEGLRILNNVITGGRAYSIDNEMPDSVVIDHNLAWNPGSQARMGQFLAYVSGRGNTASPDEMRTWGLDPNGISADPLYVDAAAGDYRLQAGSPAVDAGTVIPGVNDDLPDGRPDLGRWEAAQ